MFMSSKNLSKQHMCWPQTEVGATKVVIISARLAQSVEHETLNLRVVGSSPTLGASFYFLK